MDRYIDDFVAAIKAAPSFSAPGNGAFIVSCHTHCEAQTDSDWNKFRIGGLSMQQAVSKWRNSESMFPASSFVRLWQWFSLYHCPSCTPLNQGPAPTLPQTLRTALPPL